MDLNNEDLEFLKKHQQNVDNIFKEINEQWLISRGIQSITTIAEKTIDVAFYISYMNGTKETIKGYEKMSTKLNNLKNG